MIRLLLKLFPRVWRDRYTEEIDDLLGDSRHPLRDRLDLVRAAIILRCERTTPMTTSNQPSPALLAITSIALAFGGIAVSWALTQLEDGFREIPQHWWSTFACLPLLVGLVLATWICATTVGHGGVST